MCKEFIKHKPYGGLAMKQHGLAVTEKTAISHW